MKSILWLSICILIVPFLLFSQRILPAAPDTDLNHQNLIAFTQDTSKNEGPPDFVPVEEMPQVIKKVEPKYPEAALKDKIEGAVFVKVWIDEQGNVKKTVLLKSDKEIFNNAAVEASKQWKFTPGKIKGKPVDMWVSIPFRFSLSAGEKDHSKDSTLHYEVFNTILKSIEGILKGKDIETAKKKNVNPGAYLIYGKQYVSLYGVLNGEHKNVKLIEGPESKILSPMMFKMPGDETTAYMILKTQIGKNGPTRFHTVLLAKSSSGEWQITHWHISW
jgi:TonB family protein